MKILYLLDYLPYPPNSGDRIRVYNLIRRMATYHQVYVLSLVKTSFDSTAKEHLSGFCRYVDCADFNWDHSLSELPKIAQNLGSGKPFELNLLYSKKFEEKIRSLCETEAFDIVEVVTSRLSPYIEAFPRRGQIKFVLTFLDIAYKQYQKISQTEPVSMRKFRYWLLSQQLKRWEPHYARNYDRCFTVSEADKNLLLSDNPSLKIDVVPNGVDTNRFHPVPLAENSTALLFVGSMNYPPCIDAVTYFCQEIFPYLKKHYEQIDFWIVGRDPTPEVLKLNGNGVHVTGMVEDVVPYYQKCAVCVVPLRSGGGTRLKILEAMALGRPVVTTSLGCQGLAVVNQQHLSIADDPEQFALEIVHLLQDKNKYECMVAEARQLVVSCYEWDSIAKQLNDLYGQVVAEQTAWGPSVGKEGRQ